MEWRVNETAARLLILGTLAVVLGIGLFDWRVAAIVCGVVLIGAGVMSLDVSARPARPRDRAKRGSGTP
jgi:type IV secretory pathway TrbD component